MIKELTVVWAEVWLQVGHFLFEGNDIWVWYFPGGKHNSETNLTITNKHMEKQSVPWMWII